MGYLSLAIQPLGVKLLTLTTDIICSRLDQNWHTYRQAAEQVKWHKKKKAECLLWFAELEGLQAQHWHS